MTPSGKKHAGSWVLSVEHDDLASARARRPLIKEAAIDSAEDGCLPFEDSAISKSLLLGLLMEAFLCWPLEAP